MVLSVELLPYSLADEIVVTRTVFKRKSLTKLHIVLKHRAALHITDAAKKFMYGTFLSFAHFSFEESMSVLLCLRYH